MAAAVEGAISAGLCYEVIIVDDCSDDNTEFVAKHICETNRKVSYVRHERNMNLGGAYTTGLALARNDYVTWVPGDGTHSSLYLGMAYKEIGATDFICAVPSAFNSRTLFRKFLSRTYTYVMNVCSGQKIPYYNGLSIYKTALARKATILSDGFSFQAELMLSCLFLNATYSVVETGVDELEARPSKAFTLKNILQVSKSVWRVGMLKSNSFPRGDWRQL